MCGYVPNTESKIKKVLKLFSGNPEIKDLISEWISVYPDQRPNIEGIMKHSSFKDINWEKVKNHEYQPFFIPDLESEFDLKYFYNKTSKANYGFYLNNKISTDEFYDFEKYESKQKEKLSIGNIQKYNDANNQRRMPLGNFQIYRVNNNLKDF